MYSLLRRRTMMTKPSVVPTERLIYQLYDYTCDGTINTFIDTGIKLFGPEYSSFRIEMEYDGLDLSTTGQETVLECKSFTNLPNMGVSAGFSLRVNDGSNHPEDAVVLRLDPVLHGIYVENAFSATLSIIYNKQSSIAVINGSTKTGSGSIYHSEPLTIGGRYSSHLSNPDRFVQIHILSLKIYAIANENYQYIYLPLTFKCLTGGDLSIKNASGSYDRNFEYSLNGGVWTAFSLPANTVSKLIATLSPNDTISFRRDNDNFADAQFISDSNLTFDIYGNLLSLQYGSAFYGQTELRNTFKKAFGAIFKKTGVVDASNLMLTAPALSNNCYLDMFRDCTSLVAAPELPAATLVTGCYSWMFLGCSQLSYVKCLATNGIIYNNIAQWLKDVSNTGTFVKASGVTWPSGDSGIPNGWTVIEE